MEESQGVSEGNRANNGDSDPSLSDRLTTIEEQLQQLPRVFEAIDALTQRIVRLESDIRLNADVYRYRDLRDMLQAGQWRQADDETIRIILDLTGESNLDLLEPQQVAEMSCNDLSVIDQLWQHYSQGRYGFGVQLAIYREEGGTVESTIAQNQDIIVRLGKRVGWYKNDSWLQCDQLDYTGQAPTGCLPARWWNSPFGAKMTNTFFRRLLECRISPTT
ncbi:MAG: GUN4 domain-containing protein [Leptolyngbyaceae bacterium]|nr:GUN4 domain-containing protein [Leptolyngbyaceae bacterium]